MLLQFHDVPLNNARLPCRGRHKPMLGGSVCEHALVAVCWLVGFAAQRTCPYLAREPWRCAQRRKNAAMKQRASANGQSRCKPHGNINNAGKVPSLAATICVPLTGYCVVGHADETIVRIRGSCYSWVQHIFSWSRCEWPSALPLVLRLLKPPENAWACIFWDNIYVDCHCFCNRNVQFLQRNSSTKYLELGCSYIKHLNLSKIAGIWQLPCV